MRSAKKKSNRWIGWGTVAAVLAVLLLIGYHASERPSLADSPALSHVGSEIAPNSGVRPPREGRLPRGVTIGPQDTFVPGQVLLQFDEDFAANDQQNVLDGIGAVAVRPLRDGRRTILVEVPIATAIPDLVEALGSTAGVRIAEPNSIIRPMATPNDPDFFLQWNLDNVGQFNLRGGLDVDAPEAWDVVTGSPDVIIGVIDSGIDYNHIDLADNVWVNGREIPGNGVDDDLNGWIDDVNGIDTFNNTSDPIDEYGHGTLVSGIIAARGDNGAGGAGVMWEASLLPCKFIGAGGFGTVDGVLECLAYFSDLKDAGVDVFVTNNSWGGPFSDLMRSAIEEHETRGIIFIAAAGNLGTDNDAIPNYPSSYPTSNILSVTGFGGGLNYNYGATSVDIAAPGWFIYGPLPGNTWDFAYGTSMAAPHAAGVMGLLRALDPSMSAYEARDWILANGEPFDQAFRPTATNARLVARMPIVDSDGDGMANAWEGQYGLDPTDPSDAALDPDGDGLSNLEEFQAGSNPLLVDTDEDGLTDAEEVNTYGTDPAAFDSDDDGLSDREEVEVYFSDPLDVDSDDDGIPDGEEVDTYGTQPTNDDSDADGLDDGWEIEFGFDPLAGGEQTADADGDGLTNAEEYSAGTNPLASDTDDDGLSDLDELLNTFTVPTNPDTDGDGMRDGWEVRFGLNPLSPSDDVLDADGDGFSNVYEHDAGTSPTDPTSIPPIEPWTTYQGNAGHTGHVSLLSDPVNFEVRWQRELPLSSREQTVVIDDFRVTVLSGMDEFLGGTRLGTIVKSYDSVTGEFIWERGFLTGTKVKILHDVGEQLILGATVDPYGLGEGIRLSAETGGAQPSVIIGAPDEFVPYGGDVFDLRSAAFELQLASRDIETNDLNWSTRPPAFDQGSDDIEIAVSESYVALAAQESVNVFARGTGALLWEHTATGCGYGPLTSIMIDLQERGFVRVGDCLTAYDLSDGTVLWQVLVQDRTEGPSIGNGVIYVKNFPGFDAIDADTGATLWSWTDEGVYSNIVSTLGHVFVSLQSRTVAIDVNTQQVVWEIPETGRLAITDDGALAIVDRDGQLTLVNIDGDRDGDGLPNWWERYYGLDYLDPADGLADGDGDGLSNLDEYANRADPNDADSDDDGLTDGEEVQTHGTDPIDADSDDDRLSDGGEIAAGTDPLNPDSDGDEILDGVEVNDYGTDPNDPLSKPALIVDYFESFENGIPAGWITPEGYSQPWSVVSGEATDGTFSLRSGPTFPFQTSGIEWNGLFAAGELSFDIQGGGFNVIVDGRLAPTVTYEPGNDGWQRATVPLSQGFRTIRFEQRKPLFGQPDQFVYIDNLRYVVPQPFAYDPSNLLVVVENKLWEFEPDGRQARKPVPVPIPYPEVATGIVVTANHDIAIAAPPRLFLFNPTTSVFRSTDVTEWNPGTSVRGSGLETWGSWILASNADPDQPGLLRFDLNGELIDRPLPGRQYLDLAIGPNDTLYALRLDRETVDRIALPGFTVIDSVAVGELGTSITGIAVDDNGDILSSTARNTLRRTDPQGMLLEEISISFIQYIHYDLTRNADGDLFLARADGGATVRDNQLAPVSTFDITDVGLAGRPYVAAITREGLDRDGDGLPDWWETTEGLNADSSADAFLDPDSDGLDNTREFLELTKPQVTDTDGDGLNDGEEVLVYFTNPRREDTDRDGLTDTDEVLIWATDPNNTDTDGDTLPDGDEVAITGTDPADPDTDSDTMFDGWEIENGLDPLSGADAALDPDGDNLTNADEFGAGTDIGVADTDQDGLTDGEEVLTTGTNPLDDDTDDDSLLDGYEVAAGLDPFDGSDAQQDTDGDGFSNFLEYFAGTDPLSALSVPAPQPWTTHQGNADHDGYVPIRLRPATFHEAWSVDIEPSDDRRLGAAAAFNGIVYASPGCCVSNISLYAIDEYTGAALWNYDFATAYAISAPALENGRVFVQADDEPNSALYGFNLATGSIELQHPVQLQIAPGALTPYAGDLYGYSGFFGGLYSFSAAAPATNWSVENLNRFDDWSTAVDEEFVYYLTGRELIAHNRLTGAFEFSITGPDPNASAFQATGSPLLDDRGNVIAAVADELVYFDTRSRTIKWSVAAQFFGYRSQPTFANGVVYGNLNGDIVAIDADDGSEIWRWATPTGGIVSPAIATIDHVIVATSIETYALDVATGQPVWSYPRGGRLTFSDDKTLYIAGDDGVLTAIDTLGDLDEDQMSDRWETDNGLDPNDPADAALDNDADGLSNLDEFLQGTNPQVSDTDSDGLSDGDEVNLYQTDPNNNDTDADGLNDSDEVNVWSTDPTAPDSDSDGLNDGEEVQSYGTNPLASDTDNDTFEDRIEVLTGSDPVDQASVPQPIQSLDESFEGGTLPLGWSLVAGADAGWSVTSGDAFDGSFKLASDEIENFESAWIEFTGFFSNGFLTFELNGVPPGGDRLYVYVDGVLASQVAGATDWTPQALMMTPGIQTVSFEFRKDWNDDPPGISVLIDQFRFIADNDLDQMPNDWETAFGLDPNDPADATLDPDADGLLNLDEYNAGTSPIDADSDGDGMPDGFEVGAGLDPTSDDSQLDLDADGLANVDEFQLGTAVDDADSDSDSMPDGWEVDQGLDPLADDSQLDLDGDGLNNVSEFVAGTSANNADTDGDGMPDGWEFDNGLNPLLDDSALDPDGDGDSNLTEYQNGTDPQRAPPPPPPPPPPQPSGGGGGGGSADPTSLLLMALLFGVLIAARRRQDGRRADIDGR